MSIFGKVWHTVSHPKHPLESVVHFGEHAFSEGAHAVGSGLKDALGEGQIALDSTACALGEGMRTVEHVGANLAGAMVKQGESWAGDAADAAHNALAVIKDGIHLAAEAGQFAKQVLNTAKNDVQKIRTELQIAEETARALGVRIAAGGEALGIRVFHDMESMDAKIAIRALAIYKKAYRKAKNDLHKVQQDVQKGLKEAEKLASGVGAGLGQIRQVSGLVSAVIEDAGGDVPIVLKAMDKNLVRYGVAGLKGAGDGILGVGKAIGESGFGKQLGKALKGEGPLGEAFKIGGAVEKFAVKRLIVADVVQNALSSGIDAGNPFKHPKQWIHKVESGTAKKTLNDAISTVELASGDPTPVLREAGVHVQLSKQAQEIQGVEGKVDDAIDWSVKEYNKLPPGMSLPGLPPSTGH